MTPHHQWLHDYEPYIVPIKLAINQVIYSAEKGCIMFEPKSVDEKPIHQVHFSHVLHVLFLQNNLLSVLHLTTAHDFKVHIIRNKMAFIHGGATAFTATVCNNTAYLDSSTLLNPGFALSTSTISCPDHPLLYHCLGHVGSDQLEQALKHDLVNGIQTSNYYPIPAICKPCLARKQHCDPFPKATSTCASEPLELIHSDLHGHMPT